MTGDVPAVYDYVADETREQLYDYVADEIREQLYDWLHDAGVRFRGDQDTDDGEESPGISEPGEKFYAAVFAAFDKVRHVG